MTLLAIVTLTIVSSTYYPFHIKCSSADLLPDHWGFSIWRTVFTPGSDSAFARALDTINQWVKHECFTETNRAYVSADIQNHDYNAAREV